MTCCYFSIRGFGGIWKETRAAELFKNSKRRARLRGNQNSDQPFFGRPVFNCGSAASTFCSVARSIWLISATPMRSNSLFLISKPAFRQAFLTWPSTAYSCSGMVKLSRTSLSLSLCLASADFSVGLAAVFTAAVLAAGLAAAALAAAGLAATDFAAAGFAAALGAALAAGLAADLAAGFASALAAGAAALAAGFAATALAAAGLPAAFAATGFAATGLALTAGAFGAAAGFAAAFFAGALTSETVSTVAEPLAPAGAVTALTGDDLLIDAPYF